MKLLVGFLGAVSAANVIKHQKKSDQEMYSKFNSSISDVKELRSDSDVNGMVSQLQDGEFLVLKSYLHWCGHCAAFVPAMRYFSLAVNDADFRHKHGLPGVKVGAIDCALYDGDNCKHQGFPHFTQFTPGTNATFDFTRDTDHGHGSCEQAQHMINGILKNIGVDKEVKFTNDERERFCESKIIAEKKPKIRWSGKNSGVWAMHDAEASLISVFADIEKVMIHAKDEATRKSLANSAGNFINVVVNTLPFPHQDQTNLLEYASKLPSNHHDVPQLEGMSMNYQDNTYKSCSSDKKFSCGVWSLIHLVAAHSCDADGPSPHEVMLAFHDFIRDFFRCQDCTTNFLNSYENEQQHGRHLITHDDMDCSPLRLWLWRLHNDVTARTFVEKWGPNVDVNRTHTKVDTRWPSESQCHQCRDVNGDMIEAEVLNYMDETASKGDLALPAHFQLAETAHSRVGRSYSPIQHHAKEYPSPPIHYHDVDLGEVRVVGPHEHLTGNDL